MPRSGRARGFGRGAGLGRITLGGSFNIHPAGARKARRALLSGDGAD